eukprot:NODE_139_length_16235_cov_0.569038.p11 type:complete len:162 gc:universal NODE_139_length_16235_cov_0.569038:13473-12988(-)
MPRSKFMYVEIIVRSPSSSKLIHDDITNVTSKSANNSNKKLGTRKSLRKKLIATGPRKNSIHNTTYNLLSDVAVVRFLSQRHDSVDIFPGIVFNQHRYWKKKLTTNKFHKSFETAKRFISMSKKRYQIIWLESSNNRNFSNYHCNCILVDKARKFMTQICI